MNAFDPIAGLLILVGTLVYLHAVFRLHGLIASQRPEWIDRKGSLSFFYSGMPRVSDPNVNMAVLGVAFSRRAGELSAESAKYVRRVRILLPTLLVIFAGVLVKALAGAP